MCSRFINGVFILKFLMFLGSSFYLISCAGDEESALDNLGETAAKKKKRKQGSSNQNAGSPQVQVNLTPGQLLPHPSGQGLPVMMIPCLDPQAYLLNSQDLKSVVTSQGWPIPSHWSYYFAYAHFLTSGYKENRPGHNCGSGIETFDEERYLSLHEDVRNANVGKMVAPGLTHWLLAGRSENRATGAGGGGAPSSSSRVAYFAPDLYLSDNGDLLRSVAPGCQDFYSVPKANRESFAIDHFVQHGFRERARRGVSAGAVYLFNPQSYISVNSDLASFSPPQALAHWLNAGRFEFRDGSGLPGLPRSVLRSFVLNHPATKGPARIWANQVVLPGHETKPFLLIKISNPTKQETEIGTLFTGLTFIPAGAIGHIAAYLSGLQPRSGAPHYLDTYVEIRADRSVYVRFKYEEEVTKGPGLLRSLVSEREFALGGPGSHYENILLHLYGSENPWLPHRQLVEDSLSRSSLVTFYVRPEIIR